MNGSRAPRRAASCRNSTTRATCVESYFKGVEQAIAGLDRWRIERNLTLGHFAFGRLAMYADLAPENWPTHPAAQTLVQSLLHGSETAARRRLVLCRRLRSRRRQDRGHRPHPHQRRRCFPAQRHHRRHEGQEPRDRRAAGDRKVADHHQYPGERALCRQDRAVPRRQARGVAGRQGADGCRRPRRILSRAAFGQGAAQVDHPQPAAALRNGPRPRL